MESAKKELLEYEKYNTNSNNFQDENSTRIDPYTKFLHAMKSPVTKNKYSRRLEMFFEFLKIPGENLKEKCLTFIDNGRNNVNWVFTTILKVLKGKNKFCLIMQLIHNNYKSQKRMKNYITIPVFKIIKCCKNYNKCK